MNKILNNSNSNYLIDKNGNIYNNITNKQIKASLDKDNYPVVNLDGKNYRIARLVLRTFNDTPNHSFLNVKYRDGNKQNVHLDNLYWEDENIPNLKEEKWKKIFLDGKKTFYSISNYGRCRNDSKNTILKGRFNKTTGYVSYCLKYRLNDKYVSAHRLVMMAFCPIENMELLVVNHIDGDKTNNHISNLEWCTQQENVKHALDTGLNSTIWRNKDIWIYDLQGNFLKKDTVINFSNEVKYRNIVNCLKGVVRSVDGKYQIFDKDLGEKISPWYCKTTAKKVYAYTLNNEFIENFNSQKECAAFFGVIPSTISRCLKLHSLLLGKYIIVNEPLT